MDDHDKELLAIQSETMPEALAPYAELRDSREDELLDKANVVGVGIGHKITGGEDAGTEALIVMVDSKLPKSMLTESDLIPQTMDSRPTDVVEVGQLFAGGAQSGLTEDEVEPTDLEPFALRERIRPVRPGYSVGHFQITAGTIGAGCYDLRPFPGKPPRYYILSNNHVLANSNQARIGDPILQPGRVDGGSVPRDVIGRLSRFIPIRFDGSCNRVDAAIAEVPFHQLDRDIYWLGIPRSVGVPARVGMLVRKTGRTTDFTTGRVTVINATVNVNFGGGNVARFCDQIVTTDMSAGGDSGSLVLDFENNPVGLLFAGSATVTILNPIIAVQLQLGVRLFP